MPVEILMPVLSPTMTEGKLAKWHKYEGDAVESGDVLAEIETDKATMEVEAVDEGTMGKILVAEGSDGVPVNAPIAIILENGESPADMANIILPPATAVIPDFAPEVQAGPTHAFAPMVPSINDAVPVARGQRIFISPLARRIAEREGLDIHSLNGSGTNGRIVKRDVDAVLTSSIKVQPTTNIASLVESSGEYTEVPNSTMRKVIASRLLESKQTVPHFYLTIDCTLDAVLAMRKKLNNGSPEGDRGYKISINDFVIRAVALALRKVPAANATWTQESIRLHDNVDVSVAVATSNGLITPVVRHADQKGLAIISNEIKDLANRARERKLMPDEYQGGGFTISNLGMYGVKDFAAIINPPQSCILAIGAGEQRPVVIESSLEVATVMTCTLSVDHRSVDGSVGAQFLDAFKRLIEKPLTMML